MRVRSILRVVTHIMTTMTALIGVWSLAYWCTSLLYEQLGVTPSTYVSQMINSLFGFFIFGCSLFVIGKYARPKQAEFLQPLIDAMRRIAKGDFSVKLDTEQWKEHRLKPFGHFAENINDMATKLHQMEQMRQEFISNVSHEIQTPLTSISGFAHILQSDKLSAEERRHYLDIIENECGRLSKLSDNLLKLTTLESEHRSFDVRPFRLDNQLRDIVLACEPQWLKKELEMGVDFAAVRISGDKDLLSQVWINLLGNSIKFTEEGGLITIKLIQRGDKAVVQIADTGCGIPPGDLEHVFERFYKADKSRNRSVGGSGLGLAIVKRIVEIHRGSVIVESEAGQGTIFTVTLPTDQSIAQKSQEEIDNLGRKRLP